MGSSVFLLGPCLPEDYFLLAGRNIAVAIADGLLTLAVTPVFDALGIADVIDDDDNGAVTEP